jgi:hypothetical protein
MIYKIIILLLISDCLVATSAYAYIDPNTGGFFFQTVAPFVYGVLGVIVIFWKKITNFIKSIFRSNKEGDNPAGDE